MIFVLFGHALRKRNSCGRLANSGLLTGKANGTGDYYLPSILAMDAPLPEKSA